MSLEGPRVIYARKAEDEGEGDVLTRALSLAHEIEELLEDAPGARSPRGLPELHAARIVRAMAASLVDELEALVRGSRKTGLS